MIVKKILKAIFKKPNNQETIFKLVSLIHDQFNPNGLDCKYYFKLPKLLKIVIAIDLFSNDMDSGGVVKYLSSQSADYAGDLKEYFYEIEAYNHYDVIKKISEYFPNKFIINDWDKRTAFIDRLEKENPDFDKNEDIVYYSIKEDIYDLLKKYLKINFDLLSQLTLIFCRSR